MVNSNNDGTGQSCVAEKIITWYFGEQSWAEIGEGPEQKRKQKENLSLSDQPVGGHKRWGGGLRWGRDWAKSGDMRAARNTLFVLPTLLFYPHRNRSWRLPIFDKGSCFLWLSIKVTESQQEELRGSIWVSFEFLFRHWSAFFVQPYMVKMGWLI